MRQPISPLNLYLIGFSGTGKSALGPRVAAAIGYQYVDTDDIVVRATGKSIAEIFEKDGEQAFRDLERSALSGVAGKGGAVVSTGGGVPVDTENRRIMHETGVVVLLEAKPETVLSRLQQDKAGSVRPLLSVPNPLQRISELKRQRLDAYATADWTVHTDKLSLAEAVQEVVRGWEYLSRDRFRAPAGYPEAAVVTTASHS
ncbi:MAG: shikimate kinase, partial [Chloroflexi bacterium]|nr:shikimate kinase [Chloroflexota bacterium]